MSFETSVGTSDADSITVMGRDLSSELLGRTTFTELAFLLVRRRAPSPGETRMLDAVLVSLADHGLTPTVLAARLSRSAPCRKLAQLLLNPPIVSRDAVQRLSSVYLVLGVRRWVGSYL